MSHFQNQSQFELFPQSKNNPQEPEKKRFLLRDLTFPIENIIVILIIVVMGFVLAFSYGVEKGKMTDFSTAEASKNNDAKLTENAIIEPPTETKIQVVEKDSARSNSASSKVKEEKIEVLKIPAIEEIEEDVPLNNYTIQVASFKREVNARKEALTLKKKGYESHVVPKGSHSIVCVGKFIAKLEAERFSSKLKNKYKDCLVRRL